MPRPPGPTDSTASGDDPHAGQPVETAGAPPQAAEAAVVLLHGRGASAKSILGLVDDLYQHGATYLAPQAARNTWYPRSGYVTFEENEPWFSSALDTVKRSLEMASDAGVPPDRTLLLGFSQGGCLASEFVARNPRRYGGLVVLSGSLLGPETRRDYEGDIDETPVFLGCSSEDRYVAAERVHESASVLEGLGGDVTSQLYDGLGHAINEDELEMAERLIERLL